MGERFRFKKFHINSTWKSIFSPEALEYLSNNKEWLYNKILNSTNDNKDTNWILVIDSGDVVKDELEVSILGQLNAHKDRFQVRTVLVSEESELYKSYNNMFFLSGNLRLGAVQNLQSENVPLAEISKAIVKGDGAVEDPSLLFPYTKQVWKQKVV